MTSYPIHRFFPDSRGGDRARGHWGSSSKVVRYKVYGTWGKLMLVSEAIEISVSNLLSLNQLSSQHTWFCTHRSILSLFLSFIITIVHFLLFLNLTSYFPLGLKPSYKLIVLMDRAVLKKQSIELFFYSIKSNFSWRLLRPSTMWPHL